MKQNKKNMKKKFKTSLIDAPSVKHWGRQEKPYRILL